MQQVYSVSLTVPFVVVADNLTTALAQSDLLTMGDNATAAMTEALAAGLIAGQPLGEALHTSARLS